MPEGHSIHRLALQFSSVFGGRRLKASSPQGRFALGARLIDGRVLMGARAHGKQLFLHFGDELYLRVHLGLYGAWEFGGDETFVGASSIGAPRRVGESEDSGGAVAAYTGPPAPVGAVRLRLESEHGWADLRGASACEILNPAEVAAVTARLGPDPLQPDDDGGAGADFVRRLCSRGSAVGQLLMTQEVIAGVGNVYRAEVLFMRRLNPWLPGRTVAESEASELWGLISSAMADGVREGRIITTLPADRHSSDVVPDGTVHRQDAHYVYKRSGEPCRICGTPVAQAEMAARKLYWCPGCQA